MIKSTVMAIFLVGLACIVAAVPPVSAENAVQELPTITPEFLKSYHHLEPSGHLNDGCKVNRLGNIGIDARQFKSPIDLNLLTDRDYVYIGETSDEGWLIGDGESDKLTRPDTGHAEIWRVGPDSYEQGGIPYYMVDKVMRTIRFGPMYLKPIKVNYTPSGELELLFAFDPDSTIGLLYRTLTSLLECPCGDFGNPFHITMARGVKFRSEESRKAYFDRVDKIVAQWKTTYPDGITFGDGGVSLFANRETILESYAPSIVKGVEVDMKALGKLLNYPNQNK